MSFTVIKKIMELDNNYDLHLARILILISLISGEKHKIIKGITKLVKLDFLLRYPTALEQALEHINSPTGNLLIKPHERNSVESKMIRFRYGPWDYRYYEYLAILESKGLVLVHANNKTVEISITEKGMTTAKKLHEYEELRDFESRGMIINSEFGGFNATQLKEMMYEIVPELLDMKFGEAIGP